METTNAVRQGTWLVMGALLLIAGLLVVLIGSIEQVRGLKLLGTVLALGGSIGSWLYARP